VLAQAFRHLGRIEPVALGDMQRPRDDFYNSNSYVAGLIQAKGGIADIDLTQFIGGGHPVPQDKF
jgi:hypothetical protein